MSLGSIENNLKPVLSILKRGIEEFVAAVGAVLGKGNELTVAVQLGIPAARQFTAQIDLVETVRAFDGTIGDHNTAPRARYSHKGCREPLHIACCHCRCLQRPEQSALGIGAIGLNA